MEGKTFLRWVGPHSNMGCSLYRVDPQLDGLGPISLSNAQTQPDIPNPETILIRLGTRKKNSSKQKI
ncbi:unnamed protein product [Dovyalis caffra]|uniref:Uncharacterized protein n=1 Tax=Dovyalis caffra TaxID=77055 RepID=A0AAV1SSQ1_9ROSI|nr:unnamed protein product [Dovyalis caffra]